MNTANRHASRRAGTSRSRSGRSCRHARRGIESVELAITLPVLLFVIFGGFEYGWAVLRTVQLDHAARAGAREAALHGSNASSVEQRVLDALDDAGIKSATVTVTPVDPAGAEAGDAISVEVRVDYADVQLLGLRNFMPLPEQLRGRASMVKEPDS